MVPQHWPQKYQERVAWVVEAALVSGVEAVAPELVWVEEVRVPEEAVEVEGGAAVEQPEA